MSIKKVCLVGAGAVGKTSLVRRFITGAFSEPRHVGDGANIDKIKVIVENDSVQLMLWDLAGIDGKSPIPMAYLKNASAIIYVVDSTRPETLEAAMRARRQIETTYGRVRYSMVLFNKSDLCPGAQFLADGISAIEARGMIGLCTSAKIGEGVNTAFYLIGRLMLGKTALVAA